METRSLGRTGLQVGRLGISSSYGVPASAIEMAFERGVNYLYFGSRRTTAFRDALRSIRRQRDRAVLVVQSYTRIGGLMEWSLGRALRNAGFDHADVLLLGYWNHLVPARIVEAALELQRKGMVKYLAVSTHTRTLVPGYAEPGSPFDVVHFRYNAAHPGAERDIFPHLQADRAGMVAFTATSWGALLRGGNPMTAGDCYRFVLARPEVDVCTTGPSTVEHVKESLEAIEKPAMTLEEAEAIRKLRSKKG